MVKPVPDGYGTVTPYITLSEAAKAIAFYKKAFGAVEEHRFEGPEGKIGHAEIRIGNSKIMLADEFPEMGCKSAKTLGGSPSMLYLYVDDVDAFCAKAVEAGAKIIDPVKDQFYGDRSGGLEDPFGNRWYVATHVEDVPEAELSRRAEQAMKEMRPQ
jgi:PhnB protein